MLSLTVTASKLAISLLLIVLGRVVYDRWMRNRLYRFPPGPKPIMFLGNIHQLSVEYQERVMFEWAQRFGDIVYARFFQKHAIIINSATVAQDLLEKRSLNYSSRPPFVLLTELLGWKPSLAFLPYNTRFLRHRRWIHVAFSMKASVLKYRPVQLRETHIVLAGLLDHPDEFASHFHRFSTSLIMEIVYGHTVTSLDDEFIHLAEKGVSVTSDCGSPGSMFVDFFPILKYYPTWLPGSGWKIKALHAREIVQKMNNVPYQYVKENIAAGSAKPSFVSSLLEEHYQKGRLTEQDEEDIKGAASILYSAGTETTATVMTAFILAMVKYPDVFKHAQEEIDRVVGYDRLPDFEDRASLPYLNSIIKELYRWHVPFPLGVPHYSTTKDEYKGYTIPADATIIPNIWGMAHDPYYYRDPEEFKPERFQDKNKMPQDTVDPSEMVFGFGRRKCPGQHFADLSVYLVVANIVATMNISMLCDEDGSEINPPHDYKSGFVHAVSPFKCSICPRSQKAAGMIRQLNVSFA